MLRYPETMSTIKHFSARAAQFEEIRRKLELRPHDTPLHLNVAQQYMDKQMMPEAETIYQMILDQEPQNLGAMMGLALSLKFQMKGEEMLAVTERMLEKNENNQSFWLQKASALEMLNRLDDAQQTLNEAKSRFPNWKLSTLELKIARRNGKAEEMISRLEPQLPHIDPQKPASSHLLFEAGALYDKALKPDKAFELFRKANNAALQSPATERFDENFYVNHVQNLEAPFKDEGGADWVKSWKKAPPLDDNKPQAVFIVGFPRSGTTLLDRILLSHPSIEISEEIPAIGIVFQDIQDYSALADMSPEDITERRARYYAVMTERGIDLRKPVLVDKNPFNMVNLGLIYRLFPEAKIITMLRHPYDCLLSCYMQNFAINAPNYMFLRLSTAAKLYDNAFYAWWHCKNALPLAMKTVKYEELIGDFELAMKDILAFIGLEWDEALHNFHENVRAQGTVRTASYSQVSEKLYKSARNRWKSYRKHLKPLEKRVDPWAEYFEYDTAANGTK